MNLVKKSSKFICDLNKKLDKQIIEEYEKEIEQKIDGLIIRWQ